MEIEITGMKISEVNKLGDAIKGNWRINCLADPKDKSKDRVWIVHEELTVPMDKDAKISGICGQGD